MEMIVIAFFKGIFATLQLLHSLVGSWVVYYHDHSFLCIQFLVINHSAESSSLTLLASNSQQGQPNCTTLVVRNKQAGTCWNCKAETGGGKTALNVNAAPHGKYDCTEFPRLILLPIWDCKNEVAILKNLLDYKTVDGLCLAWWIINCAELYCCLCCNIILLPQGVREKLEKWIST